MTAPEQIDVADETAFRRRMEERRARELGEARRKVTEARRNLIEAYWAARA